MIYRNIIWIAAAFPMAVCASESTPTITAVREKAPVVSFDVYVPGPDGTLVMPPPPATMNVKTNAEGLNMVEIDGTDYVHVGNIATQASGLSYTVIDIASLKPTSLTPAQLRALDWLEANKIELENGAVVWHYTFDHSFNDIRVKGGWPSSFAQADVIKALILAHRSSSDTRYLELARRAAYAFEVPCERGGLRCEVGGVPWFEEIPVPFGYAPMILNGHLYSVVMLNRLWKATGDPRVKAAFDEGFASARKMLLRYDMGYWSAYEMRPRTHNAYLVLEPSQDKTEVREITVSSPFTPDSSITFGEKANRTFSANVAWGAFGAVTPTGRIMQGLSMAQIAPGRMSVDHDVVNFEGFDIAIRYTSPGCAPIRIGTYDWRMPTHDFMAVPNVRVEKKGEECLAHALLPAGIDQWSQITAFYHEWHTQLVTELWRISGDAKFYATAIRWRRYAEVQKEHEASKTENLLLQPLVEVREDPAADASVIEALSGQDPATLSSDRARADLSAWIVAQKIPHEQALALFEKIGQKAPDDL